MRRAAALALLVALVGVACVRSVEPRHVPSPSSAASGTPDPSGEPSVVLPPVGRQALVTGDTARAMRRLCVVPEPIPEHDRPGPAEPSAAIAEVQDQVAEVRGLAWRGPIVAEAIDDAEMDRRISAAFDAQFPADLYDRRTLAWRAIGAIGPADDLRAALLSFGEGQVVGYYDPQSGELVYLADEGELSVTEKAVLAHELTHALDDQHFDLRRFDTLSAGCRDEELATAIAVAEGSAQLFATLVLLRYPVPIGDGGLGGAGLPEDVPPFVLALQLAPYTTGQAFASAIVDEGGTAALDRAFASLPASTEQILHPGLYPDDEPVPVDVPDAAEVLGDGWDEIDVMQVGELWLRELLKLRLDAAQSAAAAGGWDGGAYRAWHRQGDTAVLLRTVWDSEADGQAFAEAMRRWIAAGSGAGRVVPFAQGTVDVAFGTDPTIVDRIAGPA